MVISSTVSFLRERLRTVFSGTVSTVLPSVDFGTSAVRLLTVSFGEGTDFRLRSHPHGTRAVGADGEAPPQPEAYRAPLRDLVEQCGLEDSSVIVGLPLRSTIVRRLEVPAVSGGDLRSVVRRKAAEVLAFPPGDVHFDYQVVSRAGRAVRVILVMIQREKLRQYLEVIREVGLHPNIVDVSTFALFNFYRYVDRDETLPDPHPNDAATLLVDVGHASTDVMVVAGEEVLYARSILRGGDSITRAIARQADVAYERARRLKHESVDLRRASGEPDGVPEETAEAVRLEVNRLVTELRRTVEYLESEVEVGPAGSVVLCGGGSRLMGLDEHLEARLDLACRTFDPQGLPDVHPPEEGPSWPVSYGLQLRNHPGDCTVRLNLLPEKRVSHNRGRARRRYRRTGVALLGLLILQLVVGVLWSYAEWRGYLTESESTLEALNPVVKRVDALRDRRESLRLRHAFLRKLEREQVPVLALLGDLAEWPENLRGNSWIRTLSYASDESHGRLKIAGVSRDFRDVSRLYRWMETRPYVLGQVNERQSRSRYRLGDRSVAMVQFSATYEVTFRDFPSGESKDPGGTVPSNGRVDGG